MRSEQIRNEADYDAALARVSELMDALTGPQGQETDPNHPDRIELDALFSQIELYEDEHYPIDPPSPSAIIEYEMDQAGLPSTDQTPHSKKQDKVS